MASIMKIENTLDSAMFIQYGEKDTLWLCMRIHCKPNLIPYRYKRHGCKEEDAKFFMAYRKVRFYKTDLQGECDSLVTR
jgi:hypothetical protein